MSELDALQKLRWLAEAERLEKAGIIAKEVPAKDSSASNTIGQLRAQLSELPAFKDIDLSKLTSAVKPMGLNISLFSGTWQPFLAYLISKGPIPATVSFAANRELRTGKYDTFRVLSILARDKLVSLAPIESMKDLKNLHRVASDEKKLNAGETVFFFDKGSKLQPLIDALKDAGANLEECSLPPFVSTWHRTTE
jgi:hypothetical protein